MIDFKRGDLRSKILGEGARAVQEGDSSRVDAAVAKATEQYLLELAEYIRAYKEFYDKNFPAALQHLEEVLRLDPTFPQAHLLKGTVLIEMKKYEEAIKSADYSLQNLFLISHAPFYTNKGVALDRLGRLDEAMFCYLQAIEIDENYRLAYKNLLLIAAKKGASLDLLIISGKIREKFSENPEFLNWTAVALLNLAELALREGNPEVSEKSVQEAGKQLELAIARDPENDSILYNLACFYSRSGRRSEAIETLKKSFEKAPSGDIKMGLLQTARNDVDFANIREDPLFKELLTSSG
jgi:tetratricopeptide (TPR) repeat protein